MTLGAAGPHSAAAKAAPATKKLAAAATAVSESARAAVLGVEILAMDGCAPSINERICTKVPAQQNFSHSYSQNQHRLAGGRDVLLRIVAGAQLTDRFPPGRPPTAAGLGRYSRHHNQRPIVTITPAQAAPRYQSTHVRAGDVTPPAGLGRFSPYLHPLAFRRPA